MRRAGTGATANQNAEPLIKGNAMTARVKNLAPAADPSELSMLAEALLPLAATTEPDDPRREAVMRTCDELLRVSAGLGAILTLLDLHADAAMDCVGLHSLLAPLHQQLVANVNRIDELF